MSRKGNMYMKKDCNKCKAWYCTKCLLGFRIEWSEAFGWVPMDPCPKPRRKYQLEAELEKRRKAAGAPTTPETPSESPSTH